MVSDEKDDRKEEEEEEEEEPKVMEMEVLLTIRGQEWIHSVLSCSRNESKLQSSSLPENVILMVGKDLFSIGIPSQLIRSTVLMDPFP